MAGLPYDPVVQLSTVLSRLSVMEGRTLAIATYNARLDDDFQVASDDPAERAEVERGMREVAGRIDRDMDPMVAARQLHTDEIVELGALRTWLEALVEMSYQGTGHRRIKNPRIWSLHDLDALAGREP
jgi:acetyl-CoA carboxylase carboxyltransferase component